MRFMPTRRDRFPDALFLIQILCGIAFGWFQFMRMRETTEGLNISWLILWGVFLVLNLVLVSRSHRMGPSRITAQNLFIYWMWLVIVGVLLFIVIACRTGTWDNRDYFTITATVLGSMIVLGIARSRHLPVSDPLVRGWLAMPFRAIPHIFMMWKISTDGHRGLDGWVVILGHITLFARITQLWLSSCQARWDRGRMGTLVGEVANELTWLGVTIAWFLKS